MKYDEIIQLINSFDRKRGCFWRLVMETTQKLNKKSRATGLPCPYGEVKAVSDVTAKLMTDYGNTVISQANKQNIEEMKNFLAQKPFGKHHTKDAGILESDKKPNKFYLAFQKISTIDRKYIVDGRIATEDEIKDLQENYLPKPSAKIVGDKKILWRTVAIENIRSIN